MTPITAEEFAAREGVSDWRFEGDHLEADFDTGSFVRGVEFIRKIADAAEAAEHHPDVDLRYPSVKVRLTTHDAGSAVTDADVALAQQISRIADNLGIDPRD